MVGSTPESSHESESSIVQGLRATIQKLNEKVVRLRESRDLFRAKNQELEARIASLTVKKEEAILLDSDEDIE